MWWEAENRTLLFTFLALSLVELRTGKTWLNFSLNEKWVEWSSQCVSNSSFFFSLTIRAFQGYNGNQTNSDFHESSALWTKLWRLDTLGFVCHEVLVDVVNLVFILQEWWLKARWSVALCQWSGEKLFLSLKNIFWKSVNCTICLLNCFLIISCKSYF